MQNTEIDINIRHLIDVLNSFPGVTTFASCGGHPEPRTPAQWPVGSWYVFMHISRNQPGLLSLEFLAWAINNAMSCSDRNILLFPTSPPPWLNEPGKSLKYSLEADGVNPEELATVLADWKRRYYCAADSAKQTKLLESMLKSIRREQKNTSVQTKRNGVAAVDSLQAG